VSHLNLGQFTEAIEELDKFSPKDEVFKTLKFGAIADAFMEINQPEDALDYYTKAVTGSNNSFLTPFFLKKAGLTAELLEKYSTAAKFYQRISDDFSDSREGNDAYKYVERAEAHL
jgi:tetratricopeptide (TPR) repeat protein